MREVEIKRIEDAGSPDVVPIVKQAGGYRVEIVYVLTNGERILDRKIRRLQREAKAFRATLPIEVEPGTRFAMFTERGFIGTRIRFALGRAR